MNEEFKQLQAGTFGLVCAFQAVARALITAHPNPDELMRALKFEGEESLSGLLSMQVPDASLDAFRDFWNGVVPYRDGELTHEGLRL